MPSFRFGSTFHLLLHFPHQFKIEVIIGYDHLNVCIV